MASTPSKAFITLFTVVVTVFCSGVGAQVFCDDGAKTVSSTNYCVYVTEMGSNIRVRLDAPASYGWLGFGFNVNGGSGMRGAEIFVATRDTGSVQISHRYASSNGQPPLLSTQSLTLISNASSTSPRFVATFDRPKSPGTTNTLSITSSTTSQKCIWAVGSSTSFSSHSSEGSVTTSALLSSANAYTTSSSSSTTSGSTTSASSSKATESAASVSVSSPVNTREIMRQAHGILMFLAWCVFAPLSVLTARFFKAKLGVWWFRLHVLFAAGGVGVLHVVAFILILLIPGSDPGDLFIFDDLLGGAHKLIGIIILFLLVGQIILGFIIDRLFNPERTSIPASDKAHWWMGRLTVLLAFANVAIGIVLFGTFVDGISVGVYAAFGVWIAVVVLLFAVLQGRGGQQHHVNGDIGDGGVKK